MRLRYLLLSSVLFFGLAVQAAEQKGLKCEKDMRPVDGAYESVELILNDSGKYDIYYELKTPGFGFPVEETRVKIAKNLTSCTFGNDDGRLARCYKSASFEGEPTNSGLESTLVEKTAVISRTGETVKSANYELVVYSPQLKDNHGEKGFPYQERPGWFEIDFRADASQGGMLSGCRTIN